MSLRRIGSVSFGLGFSILPSVWIRVLLSDLDFGFFRIGFGYFFRIGYIKSISSAADTRKRSTTRFYRKFTNR